MIYIYIGGYELLRLSNLDIITLVIVFYYTWSWFSSLKSLYLDYNRLKRLVDLKG